MSAASSPEAFGARRGAFSRMDREDPASHTVRRALLFMEEHVTRDISANDIARAAGVTPRAVQLAFRRHVGTTPTEHLRRMRLQRAHQELMTSSPGDLTVTEIAARWGFPSPSRFAAYYREEYGQLPSRTLREGHRGFTERDEQQP